MAAAQEAAREGGGVLDGGKAGGGAAPEFVVGLVHGFLGFVGGVRSCCVYEGG